MIPTLAKPTPDLYTPRAAPSPTPFTAPDIRICRASDLTATLSVLSGLTGGHVIGFIAIRNVSGTACRVHGLPVLHFADSGGNTVALPQFPVCEFLPDWQCNPQQDTLVLVDRPASVDLFMAKYRGAPPCPTEFPGIAGASLVLPDAGGELPIDLMGDGIRSCESIGVSWFMPARE